MNKVIVQHLFNILPIDDLFNLRAVSKQCKKLVKNIIKKNTYLSFRLRCAKTFILIREFGKNDKSLNEITRDAKHLYMSTKSYQILSNYTHFIDYCFKEYNNVLTLENHKFNDFFPQFDLIELNVYIERDTDKTWFMYLGDVSNDSDLLKFLNKQSGVVNMNLNVGCGEDDEDDEDDEPKYIELKFSKKFLKSSIKGLDNEYYYCTLFWWFRKFEKMPKNGTRFVYLILTDDNQEILDKIHCRVRKNYLWENKEKSIHRSEWKEYDFDKIPLFIKDV